MLLPIVGLPLCLVIHARKKLNALVSLFFVLTSNIFKMAYFGHIWRWTKIFFAGHIDKIVYTALGIGVGLAIYHICGKHRSKAA